MDKQQKKGFEMTNIEKLQEITSRMKADNLHELARELFEWKHSGLLCDGLFRKYAEELEAGGNGYFHNPYQIIEGYVIDFCLEFVANQQPPGSP